MAAGMDESWSMDFMSDELFYGRRIRLLTMAPEARLTPICQHWNQPELTGI